MFTRQRLFILLVATGALLAVVGCNEGKADGQGRFQWLPLFGDFSRDESEIVARVGEVAITQRMVGLFIDELPKEVRAHYLGADGERLALKKMIDQALMVQGAMSVKLYNDQDVARRLIAQRRNTLDSAMRNYGLLRDDKPSEQDLHSFFNDNKDKYRQEGLALGRHVECLTKQEAQEAYRRVTSGEPGNDFLHVVAEMSVNADTKKDGGNLGWFARSGFIPFIRNSKAFAKKAYDFKIGVHPPFLVGDRWQVVEITKREYERPQTFKEAKDQVTVDILPGWQDAIIKDYLLSAREKYPVQMLGKYMPGKGATAEELYNRAMAVVDVDEKFELLSMVHTDYPESDRADDALFMSAVLAQEKLQDLRVAERYLLLMLEEYPDSELVEDAKFLSKNLYNPSVLHPKSIEDLRRAN